MQRRRAFTLVELLVVVGIISVLIAILLPALAAAREQANRVKCLAQLRSMAQAARLHAADHRGHMPLAGLVGAVPEPAVVGDPRMQKYTYFQDDRGSGWLSPRPTPVSLPVALGRYLGAPVDATATDYRSMMQSLTNEEVKRHFVCPADAQPRATATLGCHSPNWVAEAGWLSYGFNEGVLGLMSFRGDRGLRGDFARVRRPTEVFLFADATPFPHPVHSFHIREGDTLYDYWAYILEHGRRLGPYGGLDHRRHRNRINVVFVDGHAETLMLPRDSAREGIPIEEAGKGDLERAGLWKGIYR